MHIAHFISIFFGLFYLAKYDPVTGEIKEFKIYTVDDNSKLYECKIDNDFMMVMYEEAYDAFQKIILNRIMK